MPIENIDTILVTLLGTGCPRPSLERFGPSTLIEAGGLRLLFDCGRGTMQRAYQVDTNTKDFDKLFLTHLHSDHTTGIPDLWITGTLYGRSENPLRIWGPRGTKSLATNMEKAFEGDYKVRQDARRHYGTSTHREGLRIEAEEVDEGFIFEEKGVRVAPFRVNHYDLYSEEPSLGYRVDYGDRCVIISGDTCFCENLIDFSKNAGLLIHEVCAGPLGIDLPDRQMVPLSHHTQPEE